MFALFFAHVVSALNVGRLGKRDAPFVPQRVDIPLSFDSQGRYVATVTMVRYFPSDRLNYAELCLGNESTATFQLHHDHTDWPDIRSGYTV